MVDECRPENRQEMSLGAKRMAIRDRFWSYYALSNIMNRLTAEHERRQSKFDLNYIFNTRRILQNFHFYHCILIEIKYLQINQTQTFVHTFRVSMQRPSLWNL